MKIIFLVISLALGMNVFAKSDKKRKPAETHGGVMRSNAQFQAVSKFALNEGGSLSRVFMIKKRIDCLKASGSIFEIQYGGQDSQGKENFEDKSMVLASEPKEDGMVDSETVTVSEYKGQDCK